MFVNEKRIFDVFNLEQESNQYLLLRFSHYLFEIMNNQETMQLRNKEKYIIQISNLMGNLIFRTNNQKNINRKINDDLKEIDKKNQIKRETEKEIKDFKKYYNRENRLLNNEDKLNEILHKKRKAQSKLYYIKEEISIIESRIEENQKRPDYSIMVIPKNRDLYLENFKFNSRKVNSLKAEIKNKKTKLTKIDSYLKRNKSQKYDFKNKQYQMKENEYKSLTEEILSLEDDLKKLIKKEKKIEEKKYNNFKKNLDITRFSISIINRVLSFLENWKIITVINPAKGSNQARRIFLNDLKEWDSFIFSHSLEMNLMISYVFSEYYINYKLFGCGGYFKEENEWDSYKARIKISKENYKKASEEQQKIVEDLNSKLPERLCSFMPYHRVFTNYESCGGRFYSPFVFLEKKIRKKILEPFNFKEIDFQAFIPNVMSYIATGKLYEERPYDMVAKEIIRSKATGDIAYLPYIIKVIKKALIIILNQYHENEENVENNYTILKLLFESGFYYSKLDYNIIYENIFVGNDKYKSRSKDEINNKYRELRNKLYETRVKQWKKAFPECELSCPRFEISPKNLLNAIKKKLPEIKDFLFCESWSWTQRIESEILIKLSKELKKDNLLPLFVHDCFYVPAEYEKKYIKIADEIMKKEVISYKEKALSELKTIDIQRKFFEEVIYTQHGKWKLNMINCDSQKRKGTVDRTEVAQSIYKLIEFDRTPLDDFFKTSPFLIYKVINLNKVQEIVRFLYVIYFKFDCLKKKEMS